MDSKGHKKPCRHKKKKIKTYERFVKKFPYRLPHLTEPSTSCPPSCKAKSNSLKDKLPLQKNLVPTRSIPIPGTMPRTGSTQTRLRNGLSNQTKELQTWSPRKKPDICRGGGRDTHQTNSRNGLTRLWSPKATCTLPSRNECDQWPDSWSGPLDKVSNPHNQVRSRPPGGLLVTAATGPIAPNTLIAVAGRKGQSN
uniref:Uncharacterized protein n=1 Tax=Mus spicilegus TaxID=10103 RepID=A0A8C6GMR6_MUSSI